MDFLTVDRNSVVRVTVERLLFICGTADFFDDGSDRVMVDLLLVCCGTTDALLDGVASLLRRTVDLDEATGFCCCRSVDLDGLTAGVRMAA